jgi:hypothetical protein
MGSYGWRYALMSLVVLEGEAYQNMEEIVKRHLKGHSPLKIARDMGIKMVEVNKNVAMWREIVQKDMESRDAARDHLNEMVERFTGLIAVLSENLESLQNYDYSGDGKQSAAKFESISGQINTTVRNIADLDSKRVDLLQKAGLLENAALGDELAEREAREEALINILRNDLCPDCKMVVARKLQAITQQVEVVQEFDDE